MAYRIWAGNNLETLIKEQKELFCSSLFEEGRWIVLQNHNMSQWLKLRLADQEGAWPSAFMMMPQQAIKQLLERFQYLREDSLSTIFFLEDLKTLLFFELKNILQENPLDAVFEPLISYINKAQKKDKGQRLFDLANHVAGIFHAYATNSLWLTDSFDHSVFPSFLPKEANTLWKWQSALWQRVFHSGCLTHVGRMMSQMVSLLSWDESFFTQAKNSPYSNDKRLRITLVGSAFLSRQALDFFRVLATKDLIDVAHLMIFPADLRDEELSKNSLCASWGRFAKSFVQGMPPFSFDLRLKDQPNFLHRLQKALATNHPLEQPDKIDASVKVFSCTTALRELEALKEELLFYLERHPKTLLNDIAVLAPDINIYAPFLQAVFLSENKIPFHVIDLKNNNDNSFYAGLQTLLKLLDPTLERAKIFSLLRHPCFQKARHFTEQDIDCLLEFTNQTGIFRESIHDKTPLAHSFHKAFERFLAGLALEDEQGWGLVRNQTKLFPLEAGVSWTKVIAEYLRLVEEIRQAIRKTLYPHHFDDWIDFLGHLVESFLKDEEGAWNPMAQQLQNLFQPLSKTDKTRTLSWSEFMAFVHDQIQSFSRYRGKLLTKGIHFSSLKPLRALPFRLIAVLGLNETDFPRVSSSYFDLGRFEPGMEDLSCENADRFSFWETLASAQESFWMFYQGRDAQSGEKKLPSTVLSELLDYLEDQGCPLSPGEESIHSFEEKSLLARGGTYSPQVWAQRQAHCNKKDTRFLLPNFQQEDLREVSDKDLRQAFLTPFRFYLERLCQVVLKPEDRSDQEDQEPWIIPFYQKENLIQTLLNDILNNQDFSVRLKDFFEAFSLSGCVSPGVFAELDQRALQEWTNNLEAQARPWRAQERPQKAIIPLVLWDNKPWTPPLLWQSNDRLLIIEVKKKPALLFKDQWRMALKVLPTFLAPCQEKSYPNNPELVIFPAHGPMARFCWNLGAQETLSLLQNAQEYWQEVTHHPLPFYPDLVEELLKQDFDAKGSSFQDLTKFTESWEAVLKPHFRLFPDRESLRDCAYSRLFLHPCRQDFELWADLFKRYNESLFQPLKKAWKIKGKEE